MSLARLLPIVQIVLAALAMLLAGCTSYTQVEPGDSFHSGMRVSNTRAWNVAPRQAMPFSRSSSQMWTQDGILLDRILIIPAVGHGKSIFKSTAEDQALPVFKRDMSAKDIEELTESSMVKLFGEGQVIVETSRLRPHRFGRDPGCMFDLAIAVTDGPDYAGIAGAFVSSQELYLIIYMAATPYYFEKHRDEALVIIRGATL